jgi:hypothetical protein
VTELPQFPSNNITTLSGDKRTQKPRKIVTFHGWLQRILPVGSGKGFRFFSSSKPPESTPASYSMAWGALSAVVTGMRRKLTIRFLLVTRFRMRGAVSSLPHMSSFKQRIQ